METDLRFPVGKPMKPTFITNLPVLQALTSAHPQQTSNEPQTIIQPSSNHPSTNPQRTSSQPSASLQPTRNHNSSDLQHTSTQPQSTHIRPPACLQHFTNQAGTNLPPINNKPPTIHQLTILYATVNNLLPKDNQPLTNVQSASSQPPRGPV